MLKPSSLFALAFVLLGYSSFSYSHTAAQYEAWFNNCNEYLEETNSIYGHNHTLSVYQGRYGPVCYLLDPVLCSENQNSIIINNAESFCSAATLNDIEATLQQSGCGENDYTLNQDSTSSDITIASSCSAPVNTASIPPSSSISHGANRHNTCNPINIPTGNKYFSIEGFSGAGTSPLEWALHFNAHQRPQLWSTPYQRQQLTITNNLVGTQRADGQSVKFTVASGSFVPPSQRVETLTLNNGLYTLRLPDNTIETYNSSGQLQSIQYPSGISHNLTYSGNTITVTRLNESLVLHLDNGNVVRVVLPDNAEINYTWDTSNSIHNLTQVTYADGSTHQFLYENTNFPHYVTGIVDENNNRISSVEYDSEGRAISSEVGSQGSGINRTQIEYHDNGTRTVTNSLGKQNTYHFTQFNGEYKMTQVEGHASANCAAANQAYTYDANGFMASKTDWKGNVTTYVHNSRGLETSRTEASGTPQARTITTEWHPTFNLRTKIIEPERETVFTYDSDARLITQEVTPR